MQASTKKKSNLKDKTNANIAFTILEYSEYCNIGTLYTVFQKKTSTHIIGYKLRNGCPILIVFDIKIPHII